jgi:hypothetical protein
MIKKTIFILVMCLTLLGCSEDNKISKVLEKCADQKINFIYKKHVFNNFLYLQKNMVKQAYIMEQSFFQIFGS